MLVEAFRAVRSRYGTLIVGYYMMIYIGRCMESARP